MSNCPQTENQSVLEHGQSVWEHTTKLISGQFEGFRLPDWFKEHHAFIVNNMHSTEDIKNYNIFHDCGKPRCIEYDVEGRRHFPNHAEVSKQTWLEYFPDDKIVGDLIGYDMCLHTETAEQIKSHNWDIKTAFTLLVTAFAEIHSNAAMFGGIESVSFKMKYKKLEKRGKMLLKMFLQDIGKEYSYVIVRKDIPEAHKSVQGTHAAIEQFRNSNLEHPSVIYVVVKNENKLKKVIKDLLELEIDFSIFREPMSPYDNSITAVCTQPLSGDKRKYMQKFMLL